MIFSRGLQIRPRRFDSGFGLHIRKPRRLASTGFFIGRDLTISSATTTGSGRAEYQYVRRIG